MPQKRILDKTKSLEYEGVASSFYLKRGLVGLGAFLASATLAGMTSQYGNLQDSLSQLRSAGYALGVVGAVFSVEVTVYNLVAGVRNHFKKSKSIEGIFYQSMEDFPKEAKMRKRD